jgi:hypothetical protein
MHYGKFRSTRASACGNGTARTRKQKQLIVRGSNYEKNDIAVLAGSGAADGGVRK